jgi:NAD+ synthase (glutamine-hydrolysing)
MKIALAQLNPTIGDLTGNAAKILEIAHQAATAGAELLLTPELSLCGYPPRDLLFNQRFIEQINHELDTLAQQLPPQLAVLVGTITPNPKALQAGQKPLYNSMALLQKGQVLQRFHKRLLPTYDVFDEARYFEASQTLNWFSWPIAEQDQPLKIGVTICEDLWNDADFWGRRLYETDPIADLAAIGVDLILNLSASPYSVGKQNLRENMLHHAALRHSLPLIYVNQVGGNDDLIFDGGSAAYDRQGDIILRHAPCQETWSLVEFIPEKSDLKLNALSPNALSPLAPLADCDEAEIWAALVLGVQDYARKCGFSKIVLGLSGGIDSALVAAIAAAALGPSNVLGVLMPSPYSSEHSISDALALGKSLGIQTELLAIAPMMQSFDQTLGELFIGRDADITEENLQSRIRGTLLMAISNKFGHLLLTTGNKSEMAVGYCTLYGDMDGGLAAIADVPKTRVYKLCEWLNQVGNLSGIPAQTTSVQPLIPTHILTKPPSAELRPGQVDQDSLPPYDVLDDILDRLVHQHQAASDLITAGFEADTVHRIVRLVKIAEFKRKQAAPGLKITDRAFGTGWRMPIACRPPVL